MKTKSLLVILFVGGIIAGCDNGSSGDNLPQRFPPKATVSEGGEKVIFHAGSPGLQELTRVPAKKGSVTIPVIAPARVVASVLSADGGQERLVLFESPDVTSLYSQYRQSKVNAERASKNLARVREMFTNQAATGKDITDAETDVGNAQATMAEYEGKLRAVGFNPAEFGQVSPRTVWLICDVTESQLRDVDKGEDVDIVFSSFPYRKFVGRAEAVGDIVDPATRTVKVRVSMRNPNGKILPGMFARVDFGDPINNVIVLPASAVVTVEGKDFVFVETEPGTFVRRRVTLLNSTETVVVVQRGIEDGEQVVTSGAMLLKGLSFGY